METNSPDYEINPGSWIPPKASNDWIVPLSTVLLAALIATICILAFNLLQRGVEGNKATRKYVPPKKSEASSQTV